jgi:glycosyltransferase involved in cell wall biosynthesis
MKKVVIFQHRLLHYRVGFFDRLRAECAKVDIDIRLLHGQASRLEKQKKDEGYLVWANKVKNLFWEFKSRDILWQTFPSDLRDADLIILMQESRILSNYPILLSRLWSKRKIAFWGHGVNFQSKAPNGFLERWKSLLICKVDWWFAYTQLTVDILKNAGYPTSQITCLNNAIDTDSFKKELASVSDEDLERARMQLGLSKGLPVGIFCGSLYPDKRLDFLFDAVDRIHLERPDFHLIILGDGPSRGLILQYASTRPWIHFMGATIGKNKAIYFKLSDFMLNPGLVGLHIVDAFCAGLVMMTTDGARHSPEIAYLKSGFNGFITPDNVDIYSKSILGLINNKKKMSGLKSASLADSEVYNIDNMVKEFLSGIMKCIGDFEKKCD